MYRFIGMNLRYPTAARKNGDQGTVFISFIVGKDGILSRINLVKGVSFECDEEAIRVVRAMPAWEPGYQRGRKVKSRFVLPIKFKLAN